MLIFTLLFIQLAIFGVLAFFLRYVLTRHISSASGHLEELTQECSKKLDEAKIKKEEAEKYYNEMLVKAKEDGEKLMAQLMKEGKLKRIRLFGKDVSRAKM